MPKKAPAKRRTQPPQADDFKSVAKRLECDEDKATFEKMLYRMAQAGSLKKRREVPDFIEDAEPEPPASKAVVPRRTRRSKGAK